MTKSYAALSVCYDKLMTDFDYDGYYQLVAPHICGRVIEYGMGSGEFTLRYISSVSQVIGVEISSEMLNIAQSKLVKYRKKLVLVNQDLMEFNPEFSADTILAVCDTFNYISDIRAVIRSAYSRLNVGGNLIFDISSEYKLRSIIGDNVFYEDNDDETLIWTNKLTDNHVDMDIIIFKSDGSDCYSRLDDSQRQYIHSYNDIMEQLTSLFTEITVYDDSLAIMGSRNDNTRLVFICKK